jgi:hypothetical protein
MKVKDLLAYSDIQAACLSDVERDISGAYVGDLLSWVMGRAQCDNAWITIMNNVNVLAVATLADVSCVILAEGVTLDADLLDLAKEKALNVFYSSMPIYETAVWFFGIAK